MIIVTSALTMSLPNYVVELQQKWFRKEMWRAFTLAKSCCLGLWFGLDFTDPDG